MAANLTRRIFGTFGSILLVEKRLIQPSCTPVPCLVQQCCSLHTSDFCCGGRPKSEWRRKRFPALTKLCPEKSEKMKTRKAFGGGRKIKVTRANHGIYIWKSKDIEFESPILDIICNTAHKDFTKKKIMVKGTIVEVDAEQFKSWYDKELQTRDTETDLQDLSENTDKILQQLKNGRILARVSSRPGQVGRVDGYLLEGNELNKYLDKTKDPTSVTSP